MQRFLGLIVVALLPFLGIGCAEELSESEPSEDQVLENPGGKADIYGVDNRTELFKSSSSHKRLAKATAALVTTNRFSIDFDHNIRISSQTWSEKLASTGQGPLCTSEAFRDQPAPGYCSAFLIAPDLMATAGHCVNVKQACEDIRVVFDFAYDRSTNEADVNIVPKDKLYRCEEVVGYLYDNNQVSGAEMVSREYWSDWAVFRLDRPVTDRSPVPISTRQPRIGQTVTAIGHPGGIPTKVTPGKVVDVSKKLYFNTDLDIYGGNSGSAAFNDAGEVEGIVIRGTGGRSFHREGSCYVSDTCDAYSATARGCTGNHVMRGDVLRHFVEAEEIVTVAADFRDTMVPDGHGDLRKKIQFNRTESIRFLTVNLLLYHPRPSDLKIKLIRDTGHEAVLLDQPTGDPRVAFSFTTHEFDGELANGDWTLVIEDVKEGAYAYSGLRRLEFIVGLGEATQPLEEERFIGSPCSSNSECDFHSEAWCFPYGVDGQAYGFCTIPCEGTCPDRAGFATTFCVSLDNGESGSCVSKSHAANAYCTGLPGSAQQQADRYLGASSASAKQASVCLPRAP